MNVEQRQAAADAHTNLFATLGRRSEPPPPQVMELILAIKDGS